MLHAITRGKSRLHLRYLGFREGDERVPEEDEITSLVFGPLAFMPKKYIAKFWVDLIRLKKPDVGSLFGDIDSVRMEFWPKRGVEPDLMIVFKCSTGANIHILVELKWNAKLSGPYQLHKQWMKFLTAEERENAVHIFISKDISEGYISLDMKNVWDDKLVLRTWLDMYSMLLQYKNDNSPLGEWSREVINFFDKIRIRPFKGFQCLVLTKALHQDEVVFFSEFRGFGDICRKHESKDLPDGDVFFIVK